MSEFEENSKEEAVEFSPVDSQDKRSNSVTDSKDGAVATKNQLKPKYTLKRGKLPHPRAVHVSHEQAGKDVKVFDVIEDAIEARTKHNKGISSASAISSAPVNKSTELVDRDDHMTPNEGHKENKSMQNDRFSVISQSERKSKRPLSASTSRGHKSGKSYTQNFGPQNSGKNNKSCISEISQKIKGLLSRICKFFKKTFTVESAADEKNIKSKENYRSKTRRPFRDTKRRNHKKNNRIRGI